MKPQRPKSFTTATPDSKISKQPAQSDIPKTTTTTVILGNPIVHNLHVFKLGKATIQRLVKVLVDL